MNNLVLLGAFFALIYFMMIRPQQQQQKKRKEMLDNLETNDSIVTIGGIHGVIKALREDKIVLSITEDVDITILKTAVGHVVEETEEDDEDDLDDDSLEEDTIDEDEKM